MNLLSIKLDILKGGFIYVLIGILFMLQTEYTDAISCFTCSSRNRNDITCEDPFNASSTSYIERCRVPKKGRDGVFPAHFCVKVTGSRFNGTTKETLMVRRCALEDMYNQCGPFKLDKEKFDSGCILTCSEDGCNSSNYKYLNTLVILISIIVTTFYSLSSHSILFSY